MWEAWSLSFRGMNGFPRLLTSFMNEFPHLDSWLVGFGGALLENSSVSMCFFVLPHRVLAALSPAPSQTHSLWPNDAILKGFNESVSKNKAFCL